MNTKINSLLLFCLFASSVAFAQQKSAKVQKKGNETIAKNKAAKPEEKKDSLVFKDKVIQRDSVREVKVKGFQPPVFPGGQSDMEQFLSQNMKYPEQAKKEKVEGDVFVRFMVKKDGSIVTPKVISGLGSGCDQEALRLLSVMPKWTPGKKDDEPVDMPYTMYIHFVLN